MGGGDWCRGTSASCVRVAPKPSGPACPAREGQLDVFGSGPGEGHDAAVSRDSLVVQQPLHMV